MATIINLKNMNWPSVCLQKKVLLVHYLTGQKHKVFAERLEVANSYMSEIYHLGRLYNPRFSLLQNLSTAYNIDQKWLIDSDILPSEIGMHCMHFVNQFADLKRLHTFNEQHDSYRQSEEEMRTLLSPAQGLNSEQISLLEKYFKPVKMISKRV